MKYEWKKYIKYYMNDVVEKFYYVNMMLMMIKNMLRI